MLGGGSMTSLTGRSLTGAPPFSRALVLANPIAGSGRARGAAQELARELEKRGVQVELRFTLGRGDARDRARRLGPEFDLVVSAGGDGTLGEILAGLSEGPARAVPVAILPAGTANVMS